MPRLHDLANRMDNKTGQWPSFAGEPSSPQSSHSSTAIFASSSPSAGINAGSESDSDFDSRDDAYLHDDYDDANEPKMAFSEARLLSGDLDFASPMRENESFDAEQYMLGRLAQSVDSSDSVPLNQQFWILYRRRNIDAWAAHVGDGSLSESAFAFAAEDAKRDVRNGSLLEPCLRGLQAWRHYDIAREYYLGTPFVGPSPEATNVALSAPHDYSHGSRQSRNTTSSQRGQESTLRPQSSVLPASQSLLSNRSSVRRRPREIALDRLLPELRAEMARDALTRGELLLAQHDCDHRERELLALCGASPADIGDLLGPEKLLVSTLLDPGARLALEKDMDNAHVIYGANARAVWQGNESSSNTHKRRDHEADDQDSSLIVLLLSFFLSIIGAVIAISIYGRKHITTAIAGTGLSAILAAVVAFITYAVAHENVSYSG